MLGATPWPASSQISGTEVSLDGLQRSQGSRHPMPFMPGEHSHTRAHQ